MVRRRQGTRHGAPMATHTYFRGMAACNAPLERKKLTMVTRGRGKGSWIEGWEGAWPGPRGPGGAVGVEDEL